MNFWCYRTNKFKAEFFWKELNEKQQLRQGWGYDDGQDLRNLIFDGGARRNLPMLKVKKDDILLVPHLPEYGKVAIVQATQDWDKGYRFEIDEIEKDYGHIFPAKFIKFFVRNNGNVSGNLQSTLKNLQRFWNINHYADDVKKLLDCAENDLLSGISYEDRLENAVVKVFDEKTFSSELYKEFNNEFTRETWEFALEKGLQELFPFYSVERVGGKLEKYHGTDILVKLPGINGEFSYAIAIQVKDYQGIVGEGVCEQIRKADNYWKDNDDVELIDKIVIVTRAMKEQNKELPKNTDIKFVFAEDLQDILCAVGKKVIGKLTNGKGE